MDKQEDDLSYYHLSGAKLGVGSIIEPGNWGRIIRSYGWQHNQALREMALEQARVSHFPRRPSRLEAAFGFLTLDEARVFRTNSQGFHHHMLYRVTLSDAGAASHVTDSRLCAPQGHIRCDWASVYWMDFEAQAAALPGIDWAAATNGVQLREILTLSPLCVEERFD